MKLYRVGLWILFLLATISLVIGMYCKASGIIFPIGYAYPLSFLRFSGICLLYIIALGVTEIALKGKK